MTGDMLLLKKSGRDDYMCVANASICGYDLNKRRESGGKRYKRSSIIAVVSGY